MAELAGYPEVVGDPPYVTTCLCGGTMRVFKDNTKQDYFHCLDCNLGGDMLLFLQRRFNKPAEEMLESLSNAAMLQPNAVSPVSARVQRLRKKAKAAKKLWRLASSRRPVEPEIQNLLLSENFPSLSLLLDNKQASWRRVLGFSSAEEVCRVLGASGQTFFPTKGWKNLLVIPTYRLPGKIQAFIFIGRGGTKHNDFIIYPVNSGLTVHTYGRTPPDVGYVGGNLLPAVKSPGIVVTSDWLMAANLQCQNLLLLSKPLPLIANVDTGVAKTDTSGNAHEDVTQRRPPTVWLSQNVAKSIKLATDWDAPVSSLEFDPNSFLSDPAPDNLISRVLASAERWEKTVTKLLKNAVSPKQLLFEWSKFGVDAVKIEYKCLNKGRHIRACMQLRDGSYLIERPGPGWFRVTGGKTRRVSNFSARIFQIYHSESVTNRVLCRGRLKTNTGTEHFLFELSTDQKMQRFRFKSKLNKFAAEKKLGWLGASPRIKRSLFQHVVKLYPPELVEADFTEVKAKFHRDYG